MGPLLYGAAGVWYWGLVSALQQCKASWVLSILSFNSSMCAAVGTGASSINCLTITSGRKWAVAVCPIFRRTLGTGAPLVHYHFRGLWVAKLELCVAIMQRQA